MLLASELGRRLPVCSKSTNSLNDTGLPSRCLTLQFSNSALVHIRLVTTKLQSESTFCYGLHVQCPPEAQDGSDLSPDSGAISRSSGTVSMWGSHWRK